MKRILIVLGLSLSLFATRSAQADSVSGFRRFALVVGTNDGGDNRIKLRYAGTDAATFANVLTEMGGVARADMLILQEPSRSAFLDAMDKLRGRIKEATAAGGRSELLVYFSGHSDENGLIFGKENLAYPEFRKQIDAMPARIRLAVVDACASGALTRLKGGSRLPAFSVDQSANLSGYAFLTSSSGSESAQESDRIRASYFTHFLISGLRGAADRNQDGKVTLGEAYEFAFQETLSQTEGTQAGAQHPGYDMRLTGTGDLVLTDLRGTSAGLVLDPKLSGRIFVRGASGALVAELQKQPGKKVELGLEPGQYDMSLDRGDSLYRALVKVDSQVHLPVSLADFKVAVRERTRSRGGPETVSEESIPVTATSTNETLGADWIPIRVALIPSLGYPGNGIGPYSHQLSINLVSGSATSIHGLQVAGLFNAGTRHIHGMQAATIMNSSDSLVGVQVGGLNRAEEGRGVQAGVVNTAGSQTGLQLGLVNFARESRGLQLGLVNFAKHSDGAVLGLVNIIGNGLHTVEATVDEKSMLRTALVLGGLHNYNYLSFDMKALSPRHLWGGSMGVGTHLPYQPFFVDLDAGGGMIFNDMDLANYSTQMRVRGLMGASPWHYLSFFCGATYNAEVWPSRTRPNLNPEREGDAWGSHFRWRQWPGFLIGVRL